MDSTPREPLLTARAARTPALARRTVLTMAALGAVGGVVAAPSSASAASASGGLAVVASRRVSDRVWDVRFRTSAMTLFEPGVRVVLPAGYDRAGTRRYPVLLLLHGGQAPGSPGDNYLEWTARGGTADVDTLGSEVILVCPDGGNGGFYVDWKAPQAPKVVDWERFHVGQLLRWVDATFRTLGGRRTRAVAGVSMGGYGALSYAARHPGVFAAASSYSGPADVFDPGMATTLLTAPVADGQLPGAIFGLDTAMMAAHDPCSLVESYRRVRLHLTIGDGDNGLASGFQEKVVSTSVRTFASRLTAHGVPFTSVVAPRAGHDWTNWNARFRSDLPGLLAALPPAR